MTYIDACLFMLFVLLLIPCWFIHLFLTYGFTNHMWELSSYMWSNTPGSTNVSSSYNRIRGSGVSCWFPDHSKCSYWSLKAAVPAINTLRPRQNGRQFPDDIFKCIFLNENKWISIKTSLKFNPEGPINNMPSLVQIMACRLVGAKPLFEPMTVILPTHICVTRPQWVNLPCALTSVNLNGLLLCYSIGCYKIIQHKSPTYGSHPLSYKMWTWQRCVLSSYHIYPQAKEFVLCVCWHPHYIKQLHHTIRIYINKFVY